MSKTHTELVPHIEEITRALQNEIDSHEIESELDTFVNTFGISLSEAKRAIIKKLGGNPQSLSRLRTYRVSELQPGLSRVDINGRILSVMKRTYERKGEERNLFSGILADGTGKIEFTAWEDYGLREGEACTFSNCYTKPWHGRTQLNLGRISEVKKISDDVLPPAEELMKDTLITVDQLTQMGGAPGARVNGLVVGIRNGSGLVFRCPECNRVLLKENCMLHGPNKGKPDLRIKGILDDGYGSLYFITNREVTEQIAGMDLEECMRIASERMDSKVVRDIVAEKLEGKYVSATGDVFTDDYRTSMLIQSLTPLQSDVREEAIVMLKALEGCT